MCLLLNKMLASIGKLNAELLSAHFGASTPSYQHASGLIKQASVLYAQAQERVAAAQSEDASKLESRRAVATHHVARHTRQADTMCAQVECVHLSESDVARFQQVVQRLHGPDRVASIKELVELLGSTHFTTDVHNPRLCERTGLACVVATPPALDEDIASGEEIRAREILGEAKHAKTFARVVGLSVVRELEAKAWRDRRVGGGVRRHQRPSVCNFFTKHGLGTPPDTDDIRVAINHVVDTTVAPRAREVVSIDLWSKWVGI